MGQARQKERERDSALNTIVAQTELIKTLQERVDMRSSLVDKGAGTRSAVIDSMESLKYQQTSLQTQMGQAEAAKAAIDVLQLEAAKALQTFGAENAQKLAEAERQADDFSQRVLKARARLDHMTLTAPIAGTVQALSVTSVGQVVSVGEETMRIVPDDAVLEVEAYIENKDIGFVRAGQDAILKIESFPFTRYGSIDATVARVATDAIPEPDAQQTSADASRQQRSSGAGGGQRVQNLVFPVTLTPKKVSMPADGVEVPLSAGMAVSVEILTGQRRILEYVFSPLVEVARGSMQER